LSCTDSLISQAVAHADALTKQGVSRSRALKHASQRFGFTTKQIMSASGRARIDPENELAGICADELDRAGRSRGRLEERHMFLAPFAA
jgi:hypothetical protein